MISIKNPCSNCRLSLYLPCDRPCKKWYRWYKSALEKLMDYEFAEEKGRLLLLPVGVRVGDKVYEIYRFLGEDDWEINIHKITLEDIPKIGRTVFLTREEAEEALEKKIKEYQGLRRRGVYNDTGRNN